MTGKIGRQKARQLLLNRPITGSHQMTLAAPRHDPIKIFRSALRFRPSRSLVGANQHCGHCRQTGSRQVDVPNQKRIAR
ncbi:MAG: hypothetical protein ABSE84_27530, partial [Isosphaeraceae bacterium]